MQRNASWRFAWPWRMTEGAEPYTMKVVRAVLKGELRHEVVLVLLCVARGDEATRCPISGILRRGAGR